MEKPKNPSVTTMDLLDDMSLDDSFSDEEEEKEKECDMGRKRTDSTLGLEQAPFGGENNLEMTEERKAKHNSMAAKESLCLSEKVTVNNGLNLKTTALTKVQSVLPSHTNKFYDPNREIEQLRDELRVSNSEIQRLILTKKVSTQHEISCNYHLAFLFASPLVRKVNKNLEMIMQLDYHQEIEGIEKQLRRTNHAINYRTDVATISNFRSVIADAPFALHFTGHGIKNDRKSLGPVHHLYENKGNILLLEDENGMADYLFEEDLKKLVQISKANRSFSHNYEVVFVSSCHSEFAGEIFHTSGANHVICIKKSETISDKASLRFSRVFYDTVFIKKYPVCKAFDIAKEDIKTLYTRSEANKYILMKNDQVDEKGKKIPHKCFPIASFTNGSLTKMGDKPLFNIIPSNLQNFRGRQKETCEVITVLNDNRLVNILGPPGIGKTAMSRAVCNHLYDRQKFEDGIIYLSLRGCESTSMFMTRLILAMDNEIMSKDEKSPKFHSKMVDHTPSPLQISNNNGPKREKMVNYIVQVLRNKEVLLILDG